MITVGEFTSAVRFFTHNSDVGLFLFWFRLVMMCTFWGTSDCSCICWVRIISCFSLRDVLCFFVGPTEDRYFATNELLLNLILTHCWMLLVLSSGVWFWSWSFVLFGHFYGKNLLFVLASRLILHIVRVMVNACIMTKCRIFYWYILSELICHLFEEVMFWVNLYVTSWKKWFFLKTVFVWMTLR